MALNLKTFKADLKTALVTVNSQNNKDGVDSDTALENLANALAEKVDAYIRTAEVTVTALTGEVSVQGSPSAQSNVTALTFKGGDSTHTGGLS